MRLGLTVALVVILGAQASRAAGGSLGGMTGLVNIPTAQTLEDGALRFGVSFIDKRWAYGERGTSHNTSYALSLGFLANLELSFRASVWEGSRFLEGVDAPKIDRMGSARFRMLREDRWLPALAVGITDVRGTRYHHALYVVGTKTLRKSGEHLAAALSVGYGAKTLRAARHVLDGSFGGIEVTAFSRLSVLLDFDTEKWNSGIRLGVSRFAATVALLGLDTFSGGMTWTHRF
jgi:hypothetical protein